MNTIETYSKARLTKNKNFDGSFYFGVITTGIFCKPSCPSPLAKEENVRYFGNILEAMGQGFRPCLRCRPDVTTHNLYDRDGHETVVKALELIHEGYLNDHRVPDLASRLFTTERTLRHQFDECLSMSPVQVANYQRCLFARNLLLSSSMTMTDIAFASGFRSLRQFNDQFKRLYKMSPTDMRKSGQSSIADDLIRIPYEATFDFGMALDFMRPRALIGVEVIGESTYSRTFMLGDAKGWFTVADLPQEKSLGLKVTTDDVRVLMRVHQLVRRMFDLETDYHHIREHLARDPLLSAIIKDQPLPPLTVAFNTFEFVLRAILGQVISVTYATTLAGQLVINNGTATPDDYPHGLDYFFPTPEMMSQPDYTDMGMAKSKMAAIKEVVGALTEKRLSLDPHQSFDDFRKDFIALKGIGEWTVNYVAMRGLGHKDAFPYSDLGVIKALSYHDKKATQREIKAYAKPWSPYRTYATLCLWQSLSDK